MTALTEGRGTGNCEVGVAAIELNTSTLVLSQISDSHSYVNTLTKINIFDPTEVKSHLFLYSPSGIRTYG